MKIIILSAILIVVSSCASLSDKAKKVQLHNQMSTLLDKCNRLGPVSATGSSMWSVESGTEEAKQSLREKAFDMGADSVVFLNLDHTFGEILIQGVALKCY